MTRNCSCFGREWCGFFATTFVTLRGLVRLLVERGSERSRMCSGVLCAVCAVHFTKPSAVRLAGIAVGASVLASLRGSIGAESGAFGVLSVVATLFRGLASKKQGAWLFYTVGLPLTRNSNKTQTKPPANVLDHTATNALPRRIQAQIFAIGRGDGTRCRQLTTQATTVERVSFSSAPRRSIPATRPLWGAATRRLRQKERPVFMDLAMNASVKAQPRESYG